VLTMADIAREIKSITRELLNVPKEDVVPEASFADDLDADSLDQVELIMMIEEEFDISIPEEDAGFIITIQDAIDYVKTILA